MLNVTKRCTDEFTDHDHPFVERYGAVDPAVVAPLDAALSQLIDRMMKMREIGAIDSTNSVLSDSIS